MPEKPVHAATLNLGGKPLTPAEWTRIERLLDQWKADVLAAAKKHPARSFKLGMRQVEAFADLLHDVPGAVPRTMFGGDSATSRAAERWMKTYTMRELDDSLNIYVGKIKDALLYGLRHQINPVQIGQMLAKATGESRVNWQLIARTEMVRANAMGRLHAVKEMGFEKVWVPPHIGACASCKRLLENQVFDVDELIDATNFGRGEGDWVACIPLHPRCRHSYLPYIAEIYDDAMEHYRGLEEAGLTNEDRIDELFDSSGQLREGVTLDQTERDAITWKTADPWREGLLAAILPHLVDVRKVSADAEHTRETLQIEQLMPALHQRAIDPDKILAYARRLKAGESAPPIEVHRWPGGQQWIENGQHRTWAARLAGHDSIEAIVRDVARPWDSLEDEARAIVGKVLDPACSDFGGSDEVDVVKVPTSLEGVLLGPTQHYVSDDDHALVPKHLDPLLWEGARLRDDTAIAIETWWETIAGEDWRTWSWIFLPENSRIPVVACDYAACRQSVRAYSHFSDTDLHFALVTLVAGRRSDVEIAPGIPMDLRILPIDAAPLHSGGFLRALGAIAPGPLWYIDGKAGAESRSMWVNGEPDVVMLDLGKTFEAYTWSQTTAAAAPLPLSLADRLVDGDDLVAKQDRIPAGDARRGRIHPGEFTSQAGNPSETFQEHAFGHLVEMRSRIHQQDHSERVETVAGIFGEQLQLHDHKGGWRAGPRAKVTQHTRQLVQALGDIPEHHAHALTLKGTKITLHDVPTAQAVRVTAPNDYETSANEELYGIFVPSKRHVIVGTSELGRETVLHEVGHALTMEGLITLHRADPALFEKLASPAWVPDHVREHIDFYDVGDQPYEVGAEAYADYCLYENGTSDSWMEWPPKARKTWKSFFEGEVSSTLKTREDLVLINGSVNGTPAHLDIHMSPRPGGDVGKMSPAPANGGVEHWITVHPHGDQEKGQPVLVRNNSDGTMTVIGGAGGSMNYMRLDPKKRITQSDSKAKDREAKAKDDAGIGGAAQTVTEEERQRQEAEFKKTQRDATRTMEKADTKIAGLQEQLHALVADQIGAKWLTHGLIRHADGREEEYELGFMERNQAMRKLIAGALQTLALGKQDNRDAEDAPYLFTERHGDFEGMPDAEGAKDPEAALDAKDPVADADNAAAADETNAPDPDAEAQRKINRKLPALDEDQATAVMKLEREIARWRRIKGKARKVTQTGKAASTAYALEWSDASITDAVRERVESEKRTIAARGLLDVADSNTFKVTYDKAFHRGAVDAIDSFTHAVLGRSALTPEATRLLGPMGAAQMVARVIADRATAVGDPEKLSLDHVRGAIADLKARMEGDVANRAAARARLAMDTAVSMSDEVKASAKGESLWTETAARSYRNEKYREAANQLGMAIAGLQAISSLEVALQHPPEKITVGGGSTPSELLGLAQRAKIKLKADQITKSGRGNYSAELPAEALQHLFSFEAPPDFEHKQRLTAIRTGKGLQKEIEKHRDTPGMADKLGPAQSQGKMFLLATQPPGTNRHWNLTGTPIEKKSEDLRAQMSLGDTLDFAPGVGKTHTGIAAAMQLMHDEPEKNHRVLVTCPATALAGWAGTVMKQGTKSAQIIGMETEHLGGGKVQTKGKGGKHRKNQIAAPADFNVISHEQLAKNPNIAKEMGCTIVIADEAQKFKNTQNQRSNALHQMGDSIDVSRGDTLSRTAWADRFGKLEEGQEHITREDRVRQFRESQLDGHLFHMSAADAGNDLPDRAAGNANPFDGQADERGYIHHEVKLDDDHRAVVQATVKRVNEMQKESRASGGAGLPFGGAPIISKAVLDRPGNAFAKTAAEQMHQALQGSIEWGGFQDHPAHADGAHAGTYAKKGVIFNEGVQELKHLHAEMQKKGIKIFSTVRPHSNAEAREKGQWESVDHETNEQIQKDYLAHKGPCVLLTTDRNSTARSWQFGDNNGGFQHGGTEFMHYSLPDKGGNATIAQREARIHRRGAQVPVSYHKLCATELPTDKRQHDRLMRERKAQQMGGNSEQLVGGKETLRHRLDAKGVAPANQLQTRAERDSAAAAAESEGTDERRD